MSLTITRAVYRPERPVASFLSEVRDTLLPRHDSKDGPLSPMLVGMTFVTGLVDSFSYLVLGHVFVANMTGNVVFLAFALAGAQGFSIASSLVALGFFLLGAFSAGMLGSRLGEDRGRLLGKCAALQALFLGVATFLAALSGSTPKSVYLYGLILTLAISMGLQNGVARKLAVPDLTTTVLTLTIVGIGADSHAAGGSGSKAGRRLTSIVAMFAGALIGALLVVHELLVYPLMIAFAVVAVISGAAWTLARNHPAWTNAVKKEP
jgi:uncharacterized membrane protein YoaK (UPF0700 family)